jgi:hypothetical protein
MTRECHIRICGGLGGQFPGATRRLQGKGRGQARFGTGQAGGTEGAAGGPGADPGPVGLWGDHPFGAGAPGSHAIASRLRATL